MMSYREPQDDVNVARVQSVMDELDRALTLLYRLVPRIL
jgi:hypothetical protein